MTGSVLFVLIDRLLDHKCETKNVLQDHFKIKNNSWCEKTTTTYLWYCSKIIPCSQKKHFPIISIDSFFGEFLIHGVCKNFLKPRKAI